MNLLDAADRGNLKELKKLIQRGIDINETGGSKASSALHFAADNGHLECVQALIDAKANVYCLNDDDQTPLHWAASGASSEHLECAKALLTAGAFFYTNDTMDQWPIDIAILNGQTAMVRHLLQVEIEHFTGRPYGKGKIAHNLQRYLDAAETHSFPEITSMICDQISLQEKTVLEKAMKKMVGRKKLPSRPTKTLGK